MVCGPVARAGREQTLLVARHSGGTPQVALDQWRADCWIDQHLVTASTFEHGEQVREQLTGTVEIRSLLPCELSRAEWPVFSQRSSARSPSEVVDSEQPLIDVSRKPGVRRDCQIAVRVARARPRPAPRSGRQTHVTSVMEPRAVWFLILAAVLVVGPYVLGVRPRTRRQWLHIAITIAFLAWLLPLMASLRSS
jgi:hypothetical protein